jgi:hypothetical protein
MAMQCHYNVFTASGFGCQGVKKKKGCAEAQPLVN